MPRPVIGVTSYGWDRGHLFVPGDYLAAVNLAGGIPVLLVADGPPPAELLDRVDGLILVGGGDVVVMGEANARRDLEPAREQLARAGFQAEVDVATGMPARRSAATPTTAGTSSSSWAAGGWAGSRRSSWAASASTCCATPACRCWSCSRGARHETV